MACNAASDVTNIDATPSPPLLNVIPELGAVQFIPSVEYNMVSVLYPTATHLDPFHVNAKPPVLNVVPVAAAQLVP